MWGYLILWRCLVLFCLFDGVVVFFVNERESLPYFRLLNKTILKLVH